jgi:hypothetical protein
MLLCLIVGHLTYLVYFIVFSSQIGVETVGLVTQAVSTRQK